MCTIYPLLPHRYLRRYEILRKKLPDKSETRILVGRDNLFNYIYERPPSDLVRFTDYHPLHNTEGFFYNMLLEDKPFRDEATLISPGNMDGTYMTECVIRELVDLEDEEKLTQLVVEYCPRHMYRSDQIGEVGGVAS